MEPDSAEVRTDRVHRAQGVIDAGGRGDHIGYLLCEDGKTGGRVTRAVGAAQVPDSLRSLGTLQGADYLDVFTLEMSGADAWSAEQWARAMFEDGRNVWTRARRRGLIGLLVGRPGDRRQVAGGTISGRGSGWLRIRSSSGFKTDELVVLVRAEQVSLLTAVRYEHRLSGPAWAAVSVLHRRLAPRLLRQAHHRLCSRDVPEGP